MICKIICQAGLFVPLVTCLSARGIQTDDVDINIQGAATSIQSLLSQPTFVPYVKPNQKIEEFIAVGDSYTAGTGSNGIAEYFAGDAVRGQRAYPMQMAADRDNWAFINGGDENLPRFSFHAYTGDTTVELVTEQLTSGDYKDDKTLPRAQPLGKPQLAVMTIGGNDAYLSEILNACVYVAWRPKDCQTVLSGLQADIDSGTLRDKINYALYQVAHAGRSASGAQPRESFQVFVLTYITFFEDTNTECDKISWAYWPWQTEPKLKTGLRKQLNDLTSKVNGIIKDAAHDLERMGVIFVDGLEDIYDGHRFCEPGHTNQQMIDYDTWFWSQYAGIQTTSEGPGEPGSTFDTKDIIDPAQILLDFVFPGHFFHASNTSETSPPWTWPGAEKYPDWDALVTAIQNNENLTAQAAPLNMLRSFHPKGTAYGKHSTLLFSAIADHRDSVATNHNSQSLSQSTPTPTSPSVSPTESCYTHYYAVLDKFDIYGAGWDGSKLGKNGEGLLNQIHKCSAVTDWTFTAMTPTVKNPYTFHAHGQTTIWQKNCIERAIASAGAPANGCSGST